MGKNLRQQRRGRGTPKYRYPSHRCIGNITYTNMPLSETGVVADIVHARGRHTPVAVIDFAGERRLTIANEGAQVGQIINNDTNGSILKLKAVPEGSKIYNIELIPGDGGRLCRSSGAFATMISKESGVCTVLLPSKKKKVLSTECLATVGTAASSGRTEKPFRKAGTRFYAMRARGKLYPYVSGVAMNAVDHPFGGQTRPGKVKTVSRHASPGRKVGSISPKRTGRKKK